MTTFSKFRASTIVFTALCFLSTTTASAAALPVAGVDVIIKNTVSHRILTAYTDADGKFKVGGSENGTYDIYISNESLPAVKTKAKNGYITGRIVILTDETIATEPEPVKKSVKKTVTPPVPVKKPFFAPLLKQN
jgi:hypothetical protein